ncbi:MAG: tetratricopeptide repeat protein [Gemmatimonadetes bacterium]|nr:tetratricopeptide repeat protein [Gemmatimonadota bacterium]
MSVNLLGTPGPAYAQPDPHPALAFESMRDTDNQPEAFTARYTALVSAVLVIGGGLLMVLGAGFGALVILAGLVLAALSCVLYVVLKLLAVPSANMFLRFLGAQSGSSTPPTKGYSAIEAMVAGGRYQDAAVAYRREIAADPSDTEARSRLAQLLMDRLEDFTAAARYLKEAREVTTNDRRKMGYSLRLVDLYRSRMGDRGKAMVELRRFIDTFPDSPHIDGVRRELSELLVEMKAGPEAD